MANKVRTIFANMSWLMVSQILTSVFAFIWTILTARYLGPSDYGVFGTAVSMLNFLSVQISLFVENGQRSLAPSRLRLAVFPEEIEGRLHRSIPRGLPTKN